MIIQIMCTCAVCVHVNCDGNETDYELSLDENKRMIERMIVSIILSSEP